MFDDTGGTNIQMEPICAPQQICLRTDIQQTSPFISSKKHAPTWPSVAEGANGAIWAMTHYISWCLLLQYAVSHSYPISIRYIPMNFVVYPKKHISMFHHVPSCSHILDQGFPKWPHKLETQIGGENLAAWWLLDLRLWCMVKFVVEFWLCFVVFKEENQSI